MKLRILSMVLMAASVQAGLEWGATEKTVQVHPSQVYAEVTFAFSNTGEEAVKICAVEPTCGCLAPKLAKRTYAPGESGELLVRFDLRGRTGKQRKAVTVKTERGAETKLFIGTDIPQAYKMMPTMIRWAQDDATRIKTARLVNPNTIPIKLHSVSSSHKDLPATLRTIREGFEYEVAVTRLPAAKNARSVIRIKTAPPPGQSDSKTLKLYVHAP